MKKNMNRLMSIMLILLLLLPSLAWAGKNIDIDYIQKDEYTIIKIIGERNRPVSITIKESLKYEYIDQGFTDDLGNIEFKVSLEEDKTYDCQVNIDGKIKNKTIIIDKYEEPEDPIKPPKEAKVDLYIKGYKGVILDEKGIKIKNKETVLDLTTRILEDHRILYENRKGYIVSIDGQGEFDKGKDSGWMYSVNGEFPDVGAGSVRLKDGDKIKWLYTFDLGDDIGAPSFRDKDEIKYENEIIKDGLKIVEDKNSTEKEIKKAIEDVVKYFKDNKSVTKAKEIKGLLKDGDNALEIFSLALERAKNEDLAMVIGEGAIDIVKSLTNLIDDKSDEDIKNKLEELSEEYLGIALNATYRIKDKKEIEKIIEKIIDTSIKVEERLIKYGKKFNKKIEKKIRIKIGKTNEDNVEIILPKLLLKKATKKDIDKIKLSTKVSAFEIDPNILGKDIEEDIKIDLERNNNRISMKVRQDKKVLGKLEDPIKVILSYDKSTKNKDNITVSLIKEDGSKESIGGIYDASNKKIKFLTKKSGKFIIEEGEKNFKDISDYKWAEDAIESMAIKGIIDGKRNDIFDPSASITRAEFAALVSRMLKYDEKPNKQLPFKDVDNSKWYYNAVSAVYENGLINGRTKTAFDPEGNITREEMAKIIGNILEEYLYKKQDKKELNRFTDKDAIAKWAGEGAAIIDHNEIIKGVNGKFNPKENATRAETAVMLHRLYELIMD